MSRRTIRAVFFDAGGTLLRPWPSVGAVYAAVATRHGMPASAETMNREFRRVWKILDAERTPGGLTVSRMDWWRRLVFAIFDSAGLDGDPSVREDCFQDLHETFTRAEAWRIFPDVADTLRELRARKLHVGVVSNWDARLPSLLEDLGLAAQVDSITVSHEVGAEKPDGRIFLAALQAAGVDPAEAWHVGDSVSDDLEGAAAAGIQGWLIDRDGAGANAPAALRDLRDLVACLDRSGS